MKHAMKLITMLTACGVLWGCASTSSIPNKQTCQTVSAEEQGYKDGQEGRTSQLTTRLDTCQFYEAVKDVGVFKQSYEKGYQAGIQLYCSPENGERLGLLGHTYQYVCPEPLQTPFLKSYLPALKMYREAHPPVQYVPYPDPFWGYPRRWYW